MDGRRELALVLLLMAWSAAMQATAISRAVVPAQDAIDYLAMAQAIERVGLPQAARGETDPMQYPIWVWGTYRALTVAGASDAAAWQAALQWAAAAALVLLMPVLYRLVRQWFTWREAILACLLFATLPEVARLGADGLTDGWHLLWTVAAVGMLATAVQRWPEVSPLRWAAGGLLIGVALTARCEVLVLLPALLVAGSIGAYRAWRQGRAVRWDGLLRGWCCTVAVAGGLAAVLVPYLVLCGCASWNDVRQRLVGRQGAAEVVPLNVTDARWAASLPAAQHASQAIANRLGETPQFGRKDYSRSSRFATPSAAAARLGKELASASGYGVGVLIVAGWWFFGRKVMATSGGVWLHTVAAVFAVAVVVFALRNGYVVSRHWLLLVALGIGFAGAALLGLAHRAGDAAVYATGSLMWRRVVVAGVLLAACLALLPKSLATVHATRAAHRQAGCWLADELAGRGLQPSATAVLDSCGWTALFTGCPTYRYESAAQAYTDPRLQYIVMPLGDVQADSPRGATLRRLLELGGRRVAEFSGPDGRPSQTVLVYTWNPTLLVERRTASDAR